MRSDRFVVELLPERCVGARGLVAIHRGAEHPPSDSIASLGQACEGTLQSLRAREQSRFGNAAVGKREARSNGSPHGPFAVNVRRAEARHPFLDEKSANAILSARPN